MKSRWILALLVVVLGVVGVRRQRPGDAERRHRRPRSSRRRPSTTWISAGRALTTAIGPDGKPHPNGVWLAWIKTHGLSDLYVIDNKFAPNGGTSGWHSHPGPSIVFVVAGTITNYSSDDPSCAPHVYTAGQSFVDPGGDDMHMLRNEDPSVTAETIAVQFLPQGATRRIEDADPGNCPQLTAERRRAGADPPSAALDG